jgi:hypothetical protein
MHASPLRIQDRRFAAGDACIAATDTGQ